MRVTNLLQILLLSIFSFACNNQEDVQPFPTPDGGTPPAVGGSDPENPVSLCDTTALANFDALDWLVPQREILDGGPGKDGIPSVDNPKFAAVAATEYLADNELIVAVEVNGEVRGYPHIILDWHEIVNDQIGDRALAITYCPLTGTANAWNRTLPGGQTTTFGVSGLLYNSNLIPYDRLTDSNWSQIYMQGINGANITQRIETYPVVETTWATFKSEFPDAKVMTLTTGFTRSYGRYPYGAYKTNSSTIFPVSNLDERLPAKERVLGVIVNCEASVYTFRDFKNEGSDVFNTTFNDKKLVVVGSEAQNYLVAYGRELPDGTVLNFTATGGAGGIVMQSSDGTQWNVFGVAVEGPLAGTRLPALDSYLGFYFAWGAFYPGLQIF